MDVTEPLRWEHEIVLDQLKAFEKALDEVDWEGIRETLRFFDERLVLHRRKEEEILFPALDTHFGSGNGPISCMLHEHQDEREKIERIRAALARGTGHPETQREVQAAGGYILGLLRNHIAKENQVLYPMAEDILPEEEKKQIEVRMSAIGYCWGPQGTKGSAQQFRMGYVA